MTRFSLFHLAFLALFLLALTLLSAPAWAQSPFFARETPVDISPAKASLDALGVNATGEYLAVWQVDAGGGNFDIWARRAVLQPDFRWLGDAFAVADSAKSERAAAVAYNPTDDEFLVVYEYVYNAEDSDVRAQRVAGSAAAPADVIGPVLSVGVTTGNENMPDVAFLAATGQYLAVYSMDGDVWGRRIARRGQGDQDGDFLGDEFIIAADAYAETHPVVAAASAESYFMVAYTYAFSPDDDDVRAQRVRGQMQNGEELLGAHPALADSADRENAPTLAYSSSAHAFITLWQVSIPFNHDIRGIWVDAGNYSDKPIIGQAFDVAADVLAMENAPQVDVDARTGEVAVAFSYADMVGSWSRPALVWLTPDPRVEKHVSRSVQALPERSFQTLAPRIRLWSGQSRFLTGYTARRGTSADADRDVYLLDVSRWGVALPIISR